MFDNDFEIESKYHPEHCVLFLTAHILSLQDVYFRSMFSLVYNNVPSRLATPELGHCQKGCIVESPECSNCELCMVQIVKVVLTP